MTAGTEREAWKTVKLADVAEIERSVVAPSQIASGTTYVGLEHIDGGGSFVNVGTVQAGELASAKFHFDSAHILYGKLRPYLKKVARPSFQGVCSTDILPIRPGRDLDRGFLYYYLRQPRLIELATVRCSGANLPRLGANTLAEFRVALPPLPEQRRIAAILDKADTIRRKRQEAIRLTEEFLRSAFLEMFGDPVTNSTRWPLRPFESFLELPLRNGETNVTEGMVAGRTLTLSAITGARFAPAAWKNALFAAAPAPNKLVDARDFLICRGNGVLPQTELDISSFSPKI